jgi:hypothetical protein
MHIGPGWDKSTDLTSVVNWFTRVSYHLLKYFLLFKNTLVVGLQLMLNPCQLMHCSDSACSLSLCMLQSLWHQNTQGHRLHGIINSWSEEKLLKLALLHNISMAMHKNIHLLFKFKKITSHYDICYHSQTVLSAIKLLCPLLREVSVCNWQGFSAKFSYCMRGVRKLTGENLKVVWDNFSTSVLPVLLRV